jgi:MGT family glycosyltransferase
VTLGTIFNTESGDVFSRLLRGLRELPAEIVVTVGRSMDPAELGPPPRHIKIEQYIPQADVLPVCDAVVSHAGSGIVTGALEHGLPQVCIPMGADQPLNAARCTALGAGLALDAQTFTPADALAATSAVLTRPSFGRAAARLQAECVAMPPASAAIALIERLAQRSSRSDV